MKKFFFLALVLICIVSLFSCSELINNGQKPSNGQGNSDISSGNNNSSEGTTSDKPSGGTKPGTSTGDKDTSGGTKPGTSTGDKDTSGGTKPGTSTGDNDTSIAVTVYIDGAKSNTIYTDSRRGYTITPPKKPEDIMTNPNSEKYFYGWFVDSNFQTPLLENTKFQNDGAIYGKWITVYSNRFKYTVSYGKATITGFTDSAPTVLVIPAYVNSFPVVGIAKDAFKNETTIRTVILCNGIEEVGGFNGCNSIEKIDIPASVTKIGASCFADCGFSEFKIPSQITEIGSSAFSGCNRITSITFPDSVKSIDSYAFYGCSGLANVTIQENVQNIGNAVFYGCTNLKTVAFAEKSQCSSIGKSAFEECSGLTSVTIPNSVTSIGDRVFFNCSGLTSITIPDSVTSIDEQAFCGCSALTSVTIPNSVTSIGGSAFYGCFGLTSVTIPFVGATKDGTGDTLFGYIFGASSSYYSSNGDRVPKSLKTVAITGGTSIDRHAFFGCSGLTSVTIPNSVTSIGQSAFYGCSGLANVTIPNSVTSIGQSAFYGCSGLTSIMIPDSITSIGVGAFFGCSGLTSITISESVTSIGNDAFSGCSGLTSITVNSGNTKYHSIGNCIIETATKTLIFGCKTSIIPSDGCVTSISYSAFSGCSGLTSITIPNSVQNIGNYVFCNCTNLKTVTFAENSQCSSIGKDAFLRCSGLTSITIPNSITSIGQSAFYECSGLTSITIGNSVTSIGDNAFYECSGLTSITIPNSVTSIGNSAFSGCSGLTSVTIGNGVTRIGDNAFRECSGLTSVTIGNGVTSIGNYAFYECYKLIEVINHSSLRIIDGSEYYNKDIGYIGYYAKHIITDAKDTYLTADENRYIFYDDGSNVYLMGYTGTDTKLVLPEASPKGKKYEIYQYAFYECSGLTSVSIGNGVTSIGNYAFYECYKLIEVVDHSSLNITAGIQYDGYIGYYAKHIITVAKDTYLSTDENGYIFYDDGSNVYLMGYTGTNTELILPEASPKGKKYEIYQYAFYGCSRLTSITIPNSVTMIGFSAFKNCTRLMSITLPFVGATKDGTINTHFGYIFGANSYDKNDSYVPSGLEAVVITGGTNIDNSAFRRCSKLTSITIPNSVTSIGKSAFYECSGLTSITIPNSVTSIGDYAFSGCSGLTSVTIPNSVTSIGESAFSKCSGLQTIYCQASSKPSGWSSWWNDHCNAKVIWNTK